MAKPKKNLAEQKPSDAESYMTVDMGGKERRIDRLDMTDAEWAATKKTAIDKGIFKFAHDREAVATDTAPMKGDSQDLLAEKKAATGAASLPARAPSESFQPEKPTRSMEEKLKEPIQIKDGDSVYTVPADQASKIDLEKLREQNKSSQDGTGGGTGTLGGKLRSVAAKLFEGASPKQTDAELVDSIQLPPTPAAKPGSTASMRAAASKDMAAEAAAPPPPLPPAPAPTTPVEPTVDQQVVNGPQVTPRPQSMGGAPAQSGQGFDIMPSAKLLGGALSDAGGWLARNLAPGDAPNMGQPPPAAAAAAAPADPEAAKIKAQMDAEMLKNRDNPQWWDSRKGPPPVTKPAGAPTNSAGGSAKVSMSSKGIADPSMPPLMDRRAEYAAASDAHSAAQMAKAESDAEGLRAEADVMRKGLREVTDMELERRLADKVAQDHVREAQAAYTKTVEEMKAPEKIDPDRWWNSRNTAQKIFAVMSAGLTRGATLGMFQDAISRDIQVQQHDIQNGRLAMGQKADAQHNVYQMARQNGLDERAAYLTAESNAWDNIERSSKLAAMSSKAPSVIAAAQEQAALANAQKIEKLAQLDSHLETQGIERKKLFLENRKLDILAMKKSGSGAPKPGKALEPAMKQHIIAADEGVKAVDRMLKMLGPESSILGGVGDEIMKRVPKSQANRNDKAVELEKRSLERAIDQSAVQKADQEFYKDKLGGVGVANWTQDDLKNLRQKFIDSKNAAIDVNTRAGSNMTGFAPGASPEMSDEDAYGMLTGEAF